MKRFHYLPILDDRNINDQGLDANGSATAAYDRTITITNADGAIYYAVGYGADAAAALADAKLVAWSMICRLGDYDSTNALYDTYAEIKVVVEALGWTVSEGSAVCAAGNLYGSSKDVGYITGKIPALTESGGRVNRVGMTRVVLTGTIEKFGFYDEYTQEAMDFDSDAELESHLINESVKAANEITEDQLQMDLLNGAGVIRYTGGATSAAELSGNTGNIDTIVYDDLVKLSIELDNNRCPKNTKLIKGSRMVDTQVVNSARYAFVGSELVPSLMRMTDYHSNQAFIPIAKYAAAGQVAKGEIGAVDNFRFIVVPEMMKWAGVGATVTDNAGYYASATADTVENFDVFPILVVGDGAFTTIGFQTDGKTVKFKTKHMKPEENYSPQDPYGETGFFSIKWYYGTMILRSERLALVKTIAEV